MQDAYRQYSAIKRLIEKYRVLFQTQKDYEDFMIEMADLFKI